MNDNSNAIGLAGRTVLIIVFVLLVGAGGWYLYEGPPLLEKQHPSIHDAAGAGNIKEVKSYLAEDINLIESMDSHGERPIHHAIKFRQTDALRLLIENGANVNAQVSGSHATPLHRAIVTGDAKIISMLLDAGADPSEPNDRGETPLAYARKHTYSDIGKIIQLLQQGKEDSPNQRMQRTDSPSHEASENFGR